MRWRPQTWHQGGGAGFPTRCRPGLPVAATAAMASWMEGAEVLRGILLSGCSAATMPAMGAARLYEPWHLHRWIGLSDTTDAQVSIGCQQVTRCWTAEYAPMPGLRFGRSPQTRPTCGGDGGRRRRTGGAPAGWRHRRIAAAVALLVALLTGETAAVGEAGEGSRRLAAACRPARDHRLNICAPDDAVPGRMRSAALSTRR